MKQLQVTFIAALLLMTAGAHAQQPTLVIRNIRVIPMTTDTILQDRDVWIANEKIIRITPAAGKRAFRKKGFRQINGTGKYLIPGLTDSHVHYKNYVSVFHECDSLYLRYGITGVLALNGRPELLRHRDSIRRGLLQGPDIVCASPPMNDSTMTAEQAVAKLDTFRQAGYDFVKIYSDLSKEGFNAFSQHAAAYGLRLAGHIPQRVTTMGVLHSRQELIAHAEEYLYSPPVNYFMGNIETPVLPDTSLIPMLAKATADAHKAVSPTLITFYSIWQTAEDVNSYLSAMPLPAIDPVAVTWDWMNSGIPQKFAAPRGRQRMQAAFDFQLQLVKAFNDRKVLLLAGTDAPTMPGLVPGYSLHLELQLLHKAGLSNYEALKTATVNAAEFLHTADRYGTISEGKEATLIILDQNPFTDIQHTLSVNTVLLKGKIVSAGQPSRGRRLF
ncbi:amidohydrolase family protein [Chitinophaga solisilvae]|uniref:amidohydrolase family protein n=1 Tax=Chitinophaga solisilvae TaxID=1233460 RepID=UPI00136D174F|nr:amidohydrolase family protein [Chitinophaga solisilvae]